MSNGGKLSKKQLNINSIQTVSRRIEREIKNPARFLKNAEERKKEDGLREHLNWLSQERINEDGRLACRRRLYKRSWQTLNLGGEILQYFLRCFQAALSGFYRR